MTAAYILLGIFSCFALQGISSLSADSCALCKNVTRKYLNESGIHIGLDSTFSLPGELSLLTSYSVHDMLVTIYFFSFNLFSVCLIHKGPVGYGTCQYRNKVTNVMLEVNTIQLFSGYI
jgi:hypothetical protein